MDYKKLGETIQRVRNLKNLTQEELAEKIESSTGYISNVENGHKKVGLGKLISIAKALDTTLDVLLGCEYQNDKVDKSLVAEIELLLRYLNEQQKHEFFILAKKLVEAIKQF